MWVAALLSTVFAPELFVLAVTLLLVGWELRGESRQPDGGRWRPRAADSVSGSGWIARRLAPRVALVGTAWTAAFVVYQGGPALLSGPVPGGEDLFASLGLIVSFAVIGVVWRRREWGPLLPAYCLLLIATSVIHAVVVPFWDVSSHVVYAAVPTGYLAAVERRFAVLFAVPLGLTWSRIALDAHTPGEALGGLALAAVIVVITIVADRDVTGQIDPPK